MKKNMRIEDFIVKYYPNISQKTLTSDSKNALLRAIVLEHYMNSNTKLINIHKLAKDCEYSRHGITRMMERLGLTDFLDYYNYISKKARLTRDLLEQHIPLYVRNDGTVDILALAKILQCEPQSLRTALKREGLSQYVSTIKGGFVKDNCLQHRELQQRRLQLAQQYCDAETIQEGIANMFRAGCDDDFIAAYFGYGKSTSQRFSIRKIRNILQQRGEIS